MPVRNRNRPRLPPVPRGKIGRLHPRLREEVCRRIDSGDKYRAIAAWLNSLPEVQLRMNEYFDGRAVTEHAISNWKSFGYTHCRRRISDPAPYYRPAETPDEEAVVVSLPRQERPKKIRARTSIVPERVLRARKFAAFYREECGNISLEDVLWRVSREYGYETEGDPRRMRCAVIAAACGEIEALLKTISLRLSLLLVSEKFGRLEIPGGLKRGARPAVSVSSLFRFYRTWKAAAVKSPELFITLPTGPRKGAAK